MRKLVLHILWHLQWLEVISHIQISHEDLPHYCSACFQAFAQLAPKVCKTSGIG